MEKSKSVLLLSGGLDSSVLLHFLRDEIPDTELTCIYIDYGQRNSTEYYFAKKQAESQQCKLVVVSLSHIARALFAGSALFSQGAEVLEYKKGVTALSDKKQVSAYVPMRNLLFTALAAAYAETLGAKNIYYGAKLRGDFSSWDNSPEFVQRVNDVLHLNDHSKITLLAPFILKNKAEIIQIGARLNVPMHNTWTCFKGGSLHCGKCLTCIDRMEAFREAGVVDTVGYE